LFGAFNRPKTTLFSVFSFSPTRGKGDAAKLR
jgi:hypothetical protein